LVGLGEGRVCEIREAEIRREVMSVVKPVEMIQIGFVKEGVSPAAITIKVKYRMPS